MPRMPRPSGPTKAKILDAAERLFAERGIDGVSVAEITAAAEQRNNSAVQYHFGDKTGLLTAITDRHLERIAARRDELLDQLPDEASLRDLAEVIVCPLAEGLDDPSAAAYLQIQANLLASPEADRMPPLLTAPWDRPTLAAVTQRLAEATADNTPEEIELRRVLIAGLIFHSLADRARRYAGHDHDNYVEALLSAVVALLEIDLVPKP